MPRGRTEELQIVPPHEPVQWYTPKQASAILGVSVRKLQEMRTQRRGPRFRKLADTDQSRVLYAGADLAEYQNSIRTVETDNYEKAS